LTYVFDGGSAYGSIIEPNSLGSGGGGDNNAAGSGGGIIRLTVGGTLAVDGDLISKGTDGGPYAEGGGSGGSISLTVGTLVGAGVISADGGNGEIRSGGGGGGGGGGRIAICYNTNDFAGTISAQGGSGYEYGGAGTIYTKLPNQTWGNLKLDNEGNIGAITPLAKGTHTFDDVNIIGKGNLGIPNDVNLVIVPDVLTLHDDGWMTVYGQVKPVDLNEFANIDINTGAHLVIDANGLIESSQVQMSSGGTLTLNDGSLLDCDTVEIQSEGTFVLNTSQAFQTVKIDANGLLTHSVGDTDLHLTVLGNMTVYPNGMIEVTGKGYGRNAGPGAGTMSGCGGGGGYGGFGSDGYCYGDFYPGGSRYGSISEPNALGSGGGGDENNAGSGGGIIRLTVGGVLTVGGTIRSNGTNGGIHAEGGGSGGSIWLTVGTLAGSGIISANGGNGNTYCDYGRCGYGGGGAGGRIALYCYSNFFEGTISVDGGTGYESGEEGTIFVDKLFYSIDSGHHQISSGGDFELKAICGQPEHRILSGGIFTLTGGFLTDLPGVAPMCMDGIDNDGDGATDFPDDVGCLHALDISELTADYNQDEKVDVKDVALLAGHWLKYAYELDVAPPPDGDNIIDFKDFAVMAENWFEEINP